MKKQDKHVRISSAKTEDQEKVLRQIIQDDVCPFCPENLKKYHKLPILEEGKFWVFTKNQWPYKGTKHSLLFILRRHAQHLSELKEEEFSELAKLAKSACQKFSIPGGALFMRFGDMRYTGGSVSHIHAQLIQGDIEEESHEPVRIKLG